MFQVVVQKNEIILSFSKFQSFISFFVLFRFSYIFSAATFNVILYQNIPTHLNKISKSSEKIIFSFASDTSCFNEKY